MFYERSVLEIQKRLLVVCEQRHIDLTPVRNASDDRLHSRIRHLLWMIETIKSWPTRGKGSGRRARKAARWIGWMYASLEELGRAEDVSLTWTSEDSRSHARFDVNHGYDRPH